MHLQFSLPCVKEMYAYIYMVNMRTTESNLCIFNYFHHLTASLFPDSVLTSFVQKKKSATEVAAAKQYRLQPDVPSDL